MKNYKAIIKYILFRLGLRSTIPAVFINQIKICENREPLIDIRNDNTFCFGGELEKQCLLRKTVAEKLKFASKKLPSGIKFKIYSAYRSIELQKELWQKGLAENRTKYPTLDNEQLEIITRGQYANPTCGFGGHQTGGAIDLTLCYADGTELDMGGLRLEYNKKTPTRAKGLTATQQQNRHMLKSALEAVGFKNYPAEWWHFCYGDRMWAAYSKQICCFYGLVEQ